MLDAVDESISAGLYPSRAISLKGPWWFFMLSLPEQYRKPIENRPLGFSHKSFRGECWVHATKPTRAEYNDAMTFAMRHGLVPPEVLFSRTPKFEELIYGGIVGRWRITGVLPAPGVSEILSGKAIDWREIASPDWRMSDCFAFTVEDVQAVPFVECNGRLGFWRVPHDVMRKLAEAAKRP